MAETIQKEPRSFWGVFIRWLAGLAITGVALFIFYSYLVSRSSCHKPLDYAIGSVDSRFNISAADFEKVTRDAADRWDKASGQDTLEEKAGAPLKINLLYDQRQAELDKLKTGSASLAESKTTLETSKENLESQVRAFNARAKEYERQVVYWNSVGGAPPEQFQALEAERKSLAAEQNRLQGLAQSLNQQVDFYNTNVSEFNQEVDFSNNKIITQGEYSSAGPVIDIYTFGDQEELRLVLMHELGHALGLDHIAGEKSIMYYFLGAQDLTNPQLLPEDLSAYAERCRFPNDVIGSLKSLYWQIMKQKQT